jgi:ribosome-binding factor A
MPSQVRIQRISDRIQQDFSEMLVGNRIHDPRLSGIFVTDVTVDRELSYADIYVSAIEGSVRSKEVLKGLESASGFIRRELSAQIKLRTFPKLRFHWDVTPENADKIERILADIRDDQKPASKKGKNVKTAQ